MFSFGTLVRFSIKGDKKINKLLWVCVVKTSRVLLKASYVLMKHPGKSLHANLDL